MCRSSIIRRRDSTLKLDIDVNSNSSGSDMNASIGSDSSFSSPSKKVSFNNSLIVKEIEEPLLPLKPGMRIVADKVIEFDDESRVKLGSQGRVISIAGKSVEVQMDDGSRFDADYDDISSIRGYHRGMRLKTRCSLAATDKTEVPAGSEGRITRATCPNGVVEIVIDRVVKIVEFERTADEGCGIVFTNNLQLFATAPNSAAEYSGLTSFKGWTLTKINSVPVASNEDVKRLCALETHLAFEIERDSVLVVAEAADVVPMNNLKSGIAVKLVRKQKIAQRKYLEAGLHGIIRKQEGGMYVIQLSNGILHEVEPVNVMPLPDDQQPKAPLVKSSSFFWSKLPSKMKISLKSRFSKKSKESHDEAL